MIFELCYIEAVFIVYKHCIFPRNEAAEKTDARRVAPIRVCVLCLCLMLDPFACLRFTGLPGKQLLPFCLHSALFICTALIFNSLSSVDTICTFSTRICTSLHATKRTECLLHRQHHFTVTADNHACYGRPNFRLLLLNSRPPYTTANKCYHRNYNTALTSSVLRANGYYTP